MRGKQNQVWSKYILWILISIQIHLCLAYAQDVDPEANQPPVQIKKIAVMPFLKGKYGLTLDDAINVPISKLIYTPENISKDGNKILTQVVHTHMAKRYDESLIPRQEVTYAFDRFQDNLEISIGKLAQEVGAALSVEYIIAGNVWRFKDRIGNKMAVESPASVAFNVFLIKVSTGQILWKAVFDKTQQSLSGNFLDAPLFFKAGGKWLTAKELAQLGVQKSFSKYPY